MVILGVWQPQKGQKRGLIFELFLRPFRAPWLKYGIHCDKTDSVGLRKGVKKGLKRGFSGLGPDLGGYPGLVRFLECFFNVFLGPF